MREPIMNMLLAVILGGYRKHGTQNVFTEFAEFSDKKIKNQKGRLQGWNPGAPV